MSSREDIAKLLGQYIPLAMDAAKYDKEHGGDGHLENPNIYTDPALVDPNKNPKNTYIIDPKTGTVYNQYDRQQEQLIKFLIIGGGFVLVLLILR